MLLILAFSLQPSHPPFAQSLQSLLAYKRHVHDTRGTFLTGCTLYPFHDCRSSSIPCSGIPCCIYLPAYAAVLAVQPVPVHDAVIRATQRQAKVICSCADPSLAQLLSSRGSEPGQLHPGDRDSPLVFLAVRHRRSRQVRCYLKLPLLRCLQCCWQSEV